MDRLPDVGDVGSWHTIGTRSLNQTVPRVPIPTQEFSCSTAILWVQVQSFKARPHWIYAGRATVLALCDGSNRAIVNQSPLNLHNPALIFLPKSSGLYFLQIDFPSWLAHAHIVVKEFTGVDERGSDQLYRIEQKLDQ